ncbi:MULTISPECIES: MFS transporter [unclassified Streptomyces]|uniref:MFS transporter n=1 Tax=unclassified Streptomyces TaxID=2593676 RepID=UPI0033B4922C
MTMTSSGEEPGAGEPSDRTAGRRTADAGSAKDGPGDGGHARDPSASEGSAADGGHGGHGGGPATADGSARGASGGRRRDTSGVPGFGRTRSELLDDRSPRPVWSRDFALFFVARAVARLGETMLPVALAAGLLRYGYGVGAVGLAMAASAAPFAGLVIFGGVIADRFSTRRLMIGADLVRLVAQSITAALFFAGHVVLWQICVIGAVNGAAAAVFQPGVASTVPRLAADIQGANGAIRIAESAAQLAGPALAGLLVAFSSAGGVFVAHAGTYALSALCLLLLRLPPAAPGSRAHTAGFKADLAEGWREFRSRTWLWAVIAIWCVYMISVWGPTVPLVATEVVQRHGPRAYGLINSALGAGTVIGGLVALRLRPRRMLRAGSLALLAFACFPAAVGAGFGVAAISAGAVIAGAGISFWGVMWATSVQTQVAPDVLNRIHAYDVAGSLAMMPVGQALAGPAASALGADNVLLVAGVMSLVVAVALLSVPAIRDLVRVEGPAPRPAGTGSVPLGQVRRPRGPRKTGARPPA